MTDKTEAKPTESEEPKAETGEEVRELDALRADGMLRNPTYQTSHLDTTGDGLIDLRSVAPVFEEARREAVRHAADVFDPNTDTTDENVIEPDGTDERQAARDAVTTEAAALPGKTEGDKAADTSAVKTEDKSAAPQATPGSSSATPSQ
jgi:hypothetical protein